MNSEEIFDNTGLTLEIQRHVSAVELNKNKFFSC